MEGPLSFGRCFHFMPGVRFASRGPSLALFGGCKFMWVMLLSRAMCSSKGFPSSYWGHALLFPSDWFGVGLAMFGVLFV